ncbi:MAG: LrgB family protein [Erysipelotrichaceae bacterium]|nr:LrgB family protein [Erysipelotrichaceae bacterium]
MTELFTSSAYLAVIVSLLSYLFGMELKKKFGYSLLNPLLISIIVTIAFLLIFDIPASTYQAKASLLSYFLTPATVALAIPLYKQFELLKKNVVAIIIGIVAGCITSALCVLAVAIIFKMDHAAYVTFLPKSITSAIGMGVAEELGGIPAITVPTIILTGIFGNIFAPMTLNLFKITNPIAKGIAIGTSSHALGTAKAMELGEVEGAMSSLSICVAGLITVVLASVFAMFI